MPSRWRKLMLRHKYSQVTAFPRLVPPWRRELSSTWFLSAFFQSHKPHPMAMILLHLNSCVCKDTFALKEERNFPDMDIIKIACKNTAQSCLDGVQISLKHLRIPKLSNSPTTFWVLTTGWSQWFGPPSGPQTPFYQLGLSSLLPAAGYSYSASQTWRWAEWEI